MKLMRIKYPLTIRTGAAHHARERELIMDYRQLEDFGNFETWERTSPDGLTAKIGVKKGASVKEAFEAQDSGFPGQVWTGEDGWW